MATASDIIRGALRKLGVRDSETPIEADEIADGLDDLNDFGSTLEQTIPLGFVPLSSVGDEVNIPREAVSMYKLNLALYMATDYGVPIPQTLVMTAAEAKDRVMTAFQSPLDVSYPDSLPIGSGNDCDYYYEDQKFFSSNNKDNF